MKIIFIRHGMTKGNEEKRYTGRTDESLSAAGRKQIEKMAGSGIYPEAGKIISSPMKRCVETAEIIYPGKNIEICNELSECDFGRFENMNYAELNGNAEYQKWIDSCGMMPFPGGESRSEFIERSVRGFEMQIGKLKSEKAESAAFIVHGGTIMSVMSRLECTGKDYFQWQTGNGSCIICSFTDGILKAEEIIDGNIY